MASKSVKEKVVCIVGLGYVGQSLAKAFSRHLSTIGFDIDESKVISLNNFQKKFQSTTDEKEIFKADIVIICVPTPITSTNQPDLEPIEKAAISIGRNLKTGAIVVLESTVYPGLTEEVLIPLLEQNSNLICGKDFFVGYSPERINPGDDEHSLDTITKVIAANENNTLETLMEIYSLITTVYRAPSIKVAEAAKVIENIQRDLNIALVNEFAIIFHKLGIDTKEVLEAAQTKWNFLPFVPGLVGGHCIPVDPYYLVERVQRIGYHPQVILAGRAINDSMPAYVADMVLKGLIESGKVVKDAKVLIMGLTYKENVTDIRESPVPYIVKTLKEYSIAKVYGLDPYLNSDIIMKMDVIPYFAESEKVDAVILAVPHKQFKNLKISDFINMMNDPGAFVDVKGIYNSSDFKARGIWYDRV